MNKKRGEENLKKKTPWHLVKGENAQGKSPCRRGGCSVLGRPGRKKTFTNFQHQIKNGHGKTKSRKPKKIAKL